MYPTENDRLLSRQEVEEQFGISRRFLETAMQRGNGPRCVKVGRLVRYRRRDVLAWIEENTVEVTQ